ncbi:hypothetical protein AAJ76_160008980 [Vairimorpha ceranae]|uniref:Uncharacterized protein n=1 Tax=Vairimorpha ceranae TaxID=40302 RepID=A0A0F9ZDK5_9MICR|nr:hypothetical protein AAJ76_160008980 [Vairimorpha ceranae]KKO75599.1 hypothetical protein AAJ76_160008980 [Vairimorpha ceranae]
MKTNKQINKSIYRIIFILQNTTLDTIFFKINKNLINLSTGCLIFPRGCVTQKIFLKM